MMHYMEVSNAWKRFIRNNGDQKTGKQDSMLGNSQQKARQLRILNPAKIFFKNEGKIEA